MPRRDEDEDTPWDALGRGTPAGRALFNLYNGDAKGKGYGNALNRHNMDRMAYADPGSKRQGLTLVHFSAQLVRFS